MLISSGIFEGRSTVGRKRAKYRGNPIKRTKIRFWNSGKLGKYIHVLYMYVRERKRHCVRKWGRDSKTLLKIKQN